MSAPAHTLDCVQCGESFSASRSDAVCCSTLCRQRHWRKGLQAWKDLAKRQALLLASDTAFIAGLAEFAEITAEALRLERLDAR